MAVRTEAFGKMKDGREITRFFISNGKGMEAGVINYGAILVDLLVPDKNGQIADVVLGYDTLEPYFENGSCFGATIGPNANRIANASFVLEGKKYELARNDGENNLHSDAELGYHKRIWDAQIEGNGVKFTLEDADGSMGFPGNKRVSVTYTITEENELQIHYHGESDRNTILNMTNHSYFNLAGHDAGRIEGHRLLLHAANYTPVLPGAIPTGEIASVKGTPFDFTTEKEIGRDINEDCEQLKLCKGFDHNFVIDGDYGTLREAARVTEETSGRVMTVLTDLPGVQFYAGNCISRTTGKNGAVYAERSGLALETQYYPDTANEPGFPSAVFGPDRAYDTVTIYRFA